MGEGRGADLLAHESGVAWYKEEVVKQRKRAQETSLVSSLCCFCVLEQIANRLCNINTLIMDAGSGCSLGLWQLGNYSHPGLH